MAPKAVWLGIVLGLTVILALTFAPAGLDSRAWASTDVDPGEPLQYGERFTLSSTVMDEDRLIWVHLPEDYATSQARYPVLYLTDGPNHFLHTAGTVEFLSRQGLMPALIIVGIANTDRTRDLTPTALPPPEVDSPALGNGGGADRFLKFIGDELIPHIEKSYRTEPYRVLAGHSLGGLFAIHAMAHCELFDAFLAVSPSLWWNGGICQRGVEEFLEGKTRLDKSLFMTLGDETGDMRTAFHSMKAFLGEQSIPGFRWGSQVFPEESHGSVVLRSHYFGFKSIFDGWRGPDSAVPEGVTGALDALKAHYDGLSKRFKFQVRPAEFQVNALGYKVLGTGEFASAVSVFEYNAKLYPASANVYDSLGEAQEKLEQLVPAQMNFKKAWELGIQSKDPNVEVYRKNYDRLTEKTKNAGN